MYYIPRTYRDGALEIVNPFFVYTDNVLMMSVSNGNWCYYDNGEMATMTPPSNWDNIIAQLESDISAIFSEQSFEGITAAGRAPTEPYQNCLDY